MLKNLLSRKTSLIFFQHKGIQDIFLIDTNIVVRTEEVASCVIHNGQTQVPDILAVYGEGKATRFRRVTDSMESINVSTPVAGSSPWRPASLPFTFFDDTPYNLTDRWFRQITPLGIRNARSVGTNDIPKAPRVTYTLGALDPIPQVTPQVFHRAAEVVLGVSFNDQSQTPDILGASSHAVFSRHTGSLISYLL